MYDCDSEIIKKRLSPEELLLSNRAAGEDSRELFGLQGDQTSQS